jgi:hypothetical protein
MCQQASADNSGKGRVIQEQLDCRGRRGGLEDDFGAVGDWELRKIDIRSPIEASGWPVARVELNHPVRGRVTDAASAPGAFDAAFKAAGQILGISPRLVSFDVCSAVPAVEGALSIQLEIRLEIDGQVYLGTSFGVDLVRCSICAWLDATSRRRPVNSPSELKANRPFQVRGTDENGDFWIFASDDEGAAEAIAAEFRSDGYPEIQQLNGTTGRPEALNRDFA